MIVDESFKSDKNNEPDYFGVNIFLNWNKEGQVLDVGSLIEKSPISNELTYVFKMPIDNDMIRKTLNLVLI